MRGSIEKKGPTIGAKAEEKEIRQEIGQELKGWLEDKKRFEGWEEKYKKEGLTEWEALEKAIKMEDLEDKKTKLEEFLALSPEALLEKHRDETIREAKKYEKWSEKAGHPDEKNYWKQEAKKTEETLKTLTLKNPRYRARQEREIKLAGKELEEVEGELKEY